MHVDYAPRELPEHKVSAYVRGSGYIRESSAGARPVAAGRCAQNRPQPFFHAWLDSLAVRNKSGCGGTVALRQLQSFRRVPPMQSVLGRLREKTAPGRTLTGCIALCSLSFSHQRRALNAEHFSLHCTGGADAAAGVLGRAQRQPAGGHPAAAAAADRQQAAAGRVQRRPRKRRGGVTGGQQYSWSRCMRHFRPSDVGAVAVLWRGRCAADVASHPLLRRARQQRRCY